MKYTFGLTIPGSIIASLANPSSAIVRLCGSLSELGAWEPSKAPLLTLQKKNFYCPKDLLNEPRFFRLDISLSGDINEFKYKYLINDQIWEGHENESRQWNRDDSKNLVDDHYYTPIDYWIDVNAKESDERSHTTKFYHEIVNDRLIHYARVSDQLYVGSCPRVLSHINNDLREQLGITAVMNLQALSDIERNCSAIFGEEKMKKTRDEYDLDLPETLRKLYEQANILFFWIPITDFSTIGRELMTPQATLVLKTMLDKGHRVYVHCNSGVGRAFGVICAYYHFILHKPLPAVQYEMAAIRSCGYFDRRFLESAQIVYKKAFE